MADTAKVTLLITIMRKGLYINYTVCILQPVSTSSGGEGSIYMTRSEKQSCMSLINHPSQLIHPEDFTH
jgi:hypothetical protein